MIEGNFEKIELLKMTDTVSESVEWLSTNTRHFYNCF